MSDASGIEEDAGAALTADLSQMARSLFSADSEVDVLARVLHLAVVTIEGCDFAGIFLVEDDSVTTPVHTDPIVAEVDMLQQHTGEGPCLDAITHGVTFSSDDLSDDPRWPRFGPAAAAKGSRSLLAVPLLTNGTLGALNLYARYPRAFTVIDRARGLLLAAMAALAFTSARTREHGERRAANLHAALATREIIGQAQGILMERERVTADQAFDILRRASQHLNRRLRDVAQTLVDTGESPDTGTFPPS